MGHMNTPAGSPDRPAADETRDHLADPVNESGIFNLPNNLTMLRIVLVPVFAYLLLAEDGQNDAYRWAAAVVFVIASITDFLDGYFARKRNLVTTFGKIADPIADKALTGVALLSLSYLGELTWWATIVILGRELAVTLLRFWVIRHGVIAASRGGKLKTVSQIVAILLYLMPITQDWQLVKVTAMGVALVLTIVTGLDYLRNALDTRARGKAAEATARADGGS